MKSYECCKFVWILAYLLSVCSVSTGQTDHQSSVAWTVEAYKYNQQWTFTKNKLSGCVFSEVNTTEGLGLLSTCSEKLTRAELLEAWGSFKSGNATEIEYVDLSCDEASDLEESCVCGLLKKKDLQTTVTNSSDDTASPVSTYAPPDDGYEYTNWNCPHTGNITYQDLLPFTNTLVMALSSPSVHAYNLSPMGSTSVAFDNLQLLIVNNGVSMGRFAFGDAGLCSLPSLQIVQVKRSIFNKTFPTDWFVPKNDTSTECLSLRIIIFEHNEIKHLGETILPSVHHVTSLQLRHNMMETISEQAFLGLTYLQELSLQNNSISWLPGDVFQPLEYVNYIDLSYNTLSTFNASLVRHLGYLEHLELSHNSLVFIEGSFKFVRSLVYLNISNNFLTSVGNETYSGSTSLSILKLDNNYISIIEEGAFKGVLFLRFLGLSYNEIHDAENLRRNMWYNLEFLQFLNLDHNYLTELLPMQFQTPPYATQLVLVILTNNQITTVDTDAFKYQDGIRYLYMGYNPMKNLSFEVFQYLTNLQQLTLDHANLDDCPLDLLPVSLNWLSLMENNLRTVPKVNKTMPVLTTLVISDNNITEISQEDFVNFPLMVGLNLSRNHLTDIAEGTFFPLDRLVVLDLSYNELDLDFKERILVGLISLQQLFLGHNSIKSLDNLFLYVNLVNDVDLSYNPITHFPDQPKTAGGKQIAVNTVRLTLKGCNISAISEAAFDNAFDLSLLDLSDNQLTEFKPLRISALSRRYGVDIRGNPLKCSCNMKWLLHKDYQYHYDMDYCEDQLRKTMVPFDSLGEEDFLCRNPVGAQCLLDNHVCTCFTNDPVTRHTTAVDCSHKGLRTMPSPIPPTSISLHLDGNNFGTLKFESVKTIMKTEKMYLQNSGIVKIANDTFDKFPFLEELYLDENELQEMSEGMFNSLNKMTTLSLEDNSIMSIEEGATKGLISLERLYLEGNMLQSLNQSTLTELNTLHFLTHLTLGDNPWSCECDNVTFKNWLQEHSDVISNLSSIMCNGTSIINIPDEDLLCYENVQFLIQHENNTMTVALTSALAAITLLMLATLFIAYKNRFIIEVLIYNRFKFRFNVKENLSCVYDGFTIYDNDVYEVRQWVRTTLLSTLEPTFRLCVPDRDILPGTVWSDAIVEHIEKSKRTIVVLSSSAMDNENMLFSFQSAYFRMKFEDPTHRICVILLSDADQSAITSSELTDPHLKAMLRAGQGIHQGDKYFWEKVLYCMPQPAREPSNTLSTVSTFNGGVCA